MKKPGLTGLFGQKKAVLLVINDFEVNVYVWQNKTLNYHITFDNNPDQKILLEQILGTYSNFPAIIVTDFVEETFRHEKIIHVTGSDRAAILQRKLDFSYRNSPYRAARVTGREKEGRKDDKVLMSGLAKPELLTPWVEACITEKIAIQSISSTAYLFNHFVTGQPFEKEYHLLIVTMENDNSLRQSYLKKGRLLFSRLTTLNTRDSANLGDNILKESIQIRQYLERIQFIPYEQRLKIIVYSAHDENELKLMARSSGINQFAVYNSTKEAEAYKFNLKGKAPKPVEYILANTLSKAKISNIYGSTKLRKYFHLKTIGRTLSYSGIAAIILAIVTNIPTLFDTFTKWTQEEQIMARTTPYQREYEELSQRFPETPIPSKEMALVVETAETILEQSYTPVQTMDIISTALLAAPDLKVTNIQWQLVEKPAQEIPADQSFGSFNPPSAQSTGNDFLDITLARNSIIQINLNGLAYSSNSFREAQDQVMVLVNSLEQIPGIVVNPTKLPTEVRSDTQVVTTVDDGELQATFSLEIFIDPRVPAEPISEASV